MEGFAMPEQVLRDVLYGLRSMRRSPGFTVIAIVTLALGIGATTAIFSVVNAVLLRPLPYQNPGGLVWIHDGMTAQDSEGWPACMADFLLWKERTRSFSHLAAYGGNAYALTGEGEAERVIGAGVTARFFDTLGIRPIRGTTFAPDADQPGRPATALISERFWRRRFAAREDVLGKVVTLNGRPTTIIGVLPASFEFRNRDADIWSILALNPPNRRGPFFLRGVARLAPGVSLAQARAELDGLGQEVERADPRKLEHARYPAVLLQEEITGNVRLLLLVLSATVSLVLLIAVFNVANLMLARATARRREMAVRLSIGAGRGRLIRQLLTESLTLAAAAGSAGVALAFAGVSLLRGTAPPGLPRVSEIAVDGHALLITVLVSMASGVLFGLAPALAATRDAPGAALKEHARGGSEGAAMRRLRGTLVVTEMALSVMLLAGAGVLIRSFVLLGGVPAGFLAAPEQLLAMQISPNSAKYRDTAALSGYWEEAVNRVRAVPGVEGAAVAITIPPDRTAFRDGFEIPGKTPPEGGPVVPVPFVSSDYFRTLGIPLLRGRYFDARDRTGSPRVTIVSETLARRYFGAGDPVGQRLKHGGPGLNNQYMEIVGVVRDVKYDGLNLSDEPVYYEAAAQSAARPMWLVVRTRGAAGAAAPAVTAQIRSIDAGVPISELNPMSRLLYDSIELPRFRASLMGGLAATALLLACVGLYGVIAYYVVQRTHEIGIRMALGATSRSVLRLIVGRAFRLVSVGVVAGTLGALALLRFLKSLLFRIEPFDKPTLAAVALLLILVAMLAAWVPARRAARIDPMEALREE
jgi:putative ABC transport system permease protein